MERARSGQRTGRRARADESEAVKPLLRGWLHLAAAVGSVAVTIGLLAQTYHDPSRWISLLIFGLSMIVLYTVSSVYHIGSWRGRPATVLRAFDHANIYLFIAGSYTPICVIVLTGWMQVVVLSLIWFLAAVGVATSVFTIRLPRWASAAMYLGMGWLALIPLPRLLEALPLQATAIFAVGGLLYSLGAVVYALRWPNPWPRIFGFHEIFHVFVVGGTAAFLIAIWSWVVPFAAG